MIKFLYLCVLIVLCVHAQENAIKSLSPSLRECYTNKYLLERDNRLPHTLNTFVSILRKIENAVGDTMDLRALSVALLHRFRQDGIVQNPSVPNQDGITPFAPLGIQFYRNAQILRLIPGNAMTFPNDSITAIERCTLHFMLSSSVELFQRQDESRVCASANLYRRYRRKVNEKEKAIPPNIVNDVETLSSDEIKNIGDKSKIDDPNSLYPALPPNHPASGRYVQQELPRSKCPVENGVVKTPWGTTSFGSVLAGIAAATQPQVTPLFDILPKKSLKNITDLQKLRVDNKWLATLAGDLAEVAVIQGPYTTDTSKMSVGMQGNWNSTALPRWFFLNSNEKLELTTAEIRGGLDGLILAHEINKGYSNRPSLRLSEIFDMYYSPRGFFDRSIRACNRGTLFTLVAPNDTMANETYHSAMLLLDDLSKVTLTFDAVKKFSVQAVNELVAYVPTNMYKDLSCAQTDKSYDVNPTSVDLTIILDTAWKFGEIQPVLANLLELIDVNPFNSNFTLINGQNGVPMINSSSTILDFYSYNSSFYENITHGFDLPLSLKKLETYLENKLDEERSGGARSNVVLIVPRVQEIPKNDKEYCLQIISRLRERNPDTTFLIMLSASKDAWAELVQNRETDLFSFILGDTENAVEYMMKVATRIKKVPKRLINTQCGASYTTYGISKPHEDYILPNGVNFYKMSSNYFFNGDKISTIKIQGSSSDSLIVCSAREDLQVNVTSKSCETITNNAHTITVSCGAATLIRDCSPLYVSVTSNASSSSYQCTDRRVCRYPNLIKYTVSYENLVCTSGATKIAFNFFILIVALSFFNLQ